MAEMEIHIAISTNRANAFKKFITLQSILNHLDPQIFAHFYILHAEADSLHFKLLASALEDGRTIVHFIDCREILSTYPQYLEFSSERQKKSLMFFAPLLLKNLPHIILLEGDLLIRKDLSLLLKETKDHSFSAVPCMWETLFEDTRTFFFQKDVQIIHNPLKPEADYERLIALGETKTALIDGLVPNHIFKGNTHFLPLKWNSQRDALDALEISPKTDWEMQWQEAQHDPSVCNFSGYLKPWLKMFPIQNQFQKEFMESSRQFKHRLKAQCFPILFPDAVNF